MVLSKIVSASVPFDTLLHLLDGILQLLKPDSMPVLYLQRGFGLGVLHFDAVKQVADAEEANALPDEAQNFHLGKVAANCQVFEGGFN